MTMLQDMTMDFIYHILIKTTGHIQLLGWVFWFCFFNLVFMTVLVAAYRSMFHLIKTWIIMVGI